MALIPMTRAQKSEQLLLDFGFGWLIQKLEAHYLHCPEGCSSRRLIEYFKTEMPKMREELCWISTNLQFTKEVQTYRDTIAVVHLLLEQSKARIIVHREEEKLVPVWPEELEWAHGQPSEDACIIQI